MKTEQRRLTGHPISCGKIRDDQGLWKQRETYISEHSAVKFSHGYCPEYGEKALGELRDNNRKW